MYESFDPYYEWLGIPPAQQPPNLYQLLGIQPFESNVKVISIASDKQMSYFHSLKASKHVAESQRLLTEVSKARIVLLDPDKKQAYDAELRRQLSAGQTNPASNAAQASNQAPPPAALHRPPPQGAPQPAPVRQAPVPAQLATPEPNGETATGNSGVLDVEIQADPNASRIGARSKIQKRKINKQKPAPTLGGMPLLLIVAAGGGVGLLLLLLGVVAVVMFSGSAPKIVIPLTDQERQSITQIQVNGARVALPPQGALEVQCQRGDNTLLIDRSNYKSISQTVYVDQPMVEPILQWRPQATLVLNWPLENRRGAALEIDGKRRSVVSDVHHQDAQQVIFAVTPGPHQVAIHWVNAEPFSELVAVNPQAAAHVDVMGQGRTKSDGRAYHLGDRKCEGLWYSFDANDSFPELRGLQRTSGIIGEAALFRAVDDEIRVPRVIADDFSIGFWIQTTASTSARQWYHGYPLIDGDVPFFKYDFGVAVAGRVLAFGTGRPDKTYKAKTDITDGEWHHCCVVRSGDTGSIKMYVDGQLEVDVSGSTATLDASPELGLGTMAHYKGDGKRFEGKLDELFIFSSCLTEEEVQQLFEKKLTVTPAGS